MLRRERRSLNVASPEITLTPLIDTALVLLVIFMITAPMMNNGIKIDLPKGKSQEAKGIAQEIVVTIDNAGQLGLNGISLKKENLVKEIERLIGNRKNKVVYVNAFANIQYKTVAEIIDIVKYAAGVDHVVLGLEKG